MLPRERNWAAASSWWRDLGRGLSFCPLVLACKTERREQEAGRTHQESSLGIPAHVTVLNTSPAQSDGYACCCIVFLATSLLVPVSGTRIFWSQAPRDPHLSSHCVWGRSQNRLCSGPATREGAADKTAEEEGETESR